MKIFNIVVLALSGLALFYACSMRLINPSKGVFLQSYFENSANNLATHSDLANEIRGVGAVMLLGGVVAFLGIIRPDLQFTSFLVLTVIFGGVILGRIFSFFMDGIPHNNLLSAAMAEGILAVLNVIGLANTLLASADV